MFFGNVISYRWLKAGEPVHATTNWKHESRGQGMFPIGSTLQFVLSILLCLQVAVFSDPAHARPQSLCDLAAQQAALETSVPVAVLQAITRTETGRRQGGKLTPWPWAVNMEGQGIWFETEAEAKAYVEHHYKTGARSFDVGCFQINYKWHGSAFSSPAAMFDPLANARYAAKFLTELYDEFGDWSMAAGAYHSRTPEFAKTYRARFDHVRTALGAETDAVQGADITPHRSVKRTGVNGYPFLNAGGSAAPLRGSLVPLMSASRPALIAF